MRGADRPNRWPVLLGLPLVLGLSSLALGCRCNPGAPADPGSGAGKATAATPEVAAVEAAGLVEPALAGWLGRMAKNPRDFSDLTGSSDGWNALWEGELLQAIEAFAGSLAAASPEQAFPHQVGLARAHIELGSFYQGLHRATLELTGQYLAERETRREKIGPILPVEVLYGAQVRLLRDGPAASAMAAEALGKLAADPAAGAFGTMARAWQGYAVALAGDAAGAEAHWAAAVTAGAADPNVALLCSYLRQRAGLPVVGEQPLSGDGSPYGRRLRVAALLRSGDPTQALRELASLSYKESDHTVRLNESPGEGAVPPSAPGTGSAAAAAASEAATLAEEKTSLDFFSLTLFEELARSHFQAAAKTLAEVVGPGGCGAFWRGRALEALGDRDGALAAYALVQPSPPPAAAAAPAPGSAAVAEPAAATPDPIACLAIDVHGSVAELAYTAEVRRAVLQGQAPAGAEPKAWVSRLARLLALAQLDPRAPGLRDQLSFLPEDPRTLETLLEAAFEKAFDEQGVNAVFRGRFFEHHVHDLYLVRAQIATLIGEPRLAVKTLDALHDNTQQDAFSTLNRAGYLLDAAMARWRARDPQGAGVLLNVLWKRLPEVWPTSEFVRRIRAFQALDNIKSEAPIKG